MINDCATKGFEKVNKTNVIRLKKDDVVETLEELLKKANKGEIDSMAVTGELKNGKSFVAMANVSIFDLHVLIAYLQAMHMQQYFEAYDSEFE